MLEKELNQSHEDYLIWKINDALDYLAFYIYHPHLDQSSKEALERYGIISVEIKI